MHSLPAPDPLPVAGVAFIAIDDIGRAFRFAMRNQGRQDRGDFEKSEGRHRGYTALEAARSITSSAVLGGSFS